MSLIEIFKPILQLTAMIVGDALLAKWLGAWKFYLEKQMDPRWNDQMVAEYRKYDDEFRRVADKDKPLP